MPCIARPSKSYGTNHFRPNRATLVSRVWTPAQRKPAASSGRSLRAGRRSSRRRAPNSNDRPHARTAFHGGFCMNHDLLIKNGTVIDGTGKDRFRGDVAVKAGRIVQVGRVDGAAAKVIDAEGQIVCPGFVDPHTHYDAQITWDRLLSSSAEHGITTVTMGNCGVGIAPCRPAARELLIDDLVTVEGIDKNVLAQGIEWGWETFPQYIDAAEKRGTALNLAFLAPLAPLRTYVLGSEAN